MVTRNCLSQKQNVKVSAHKKQMLFVQPVMEGCKRLCFFFWWLMKMFHQPLLHLLMENIRLWDCACQISLPVRLQDQKHSGRSPRNAHNRAYLPSSGLSTVCPLTSWISCRGDGERVDGEGEGAEDAGDQTKCRREQGAPAHYMTDRCSKWAALSTDSNLAASSACTRHTSSAKQWRIMAVHFIPIHVFCSLRHASPLPGWTRASALRAETWAVGRGTMTPPGRWTPEALPQHHLCCCSALCLHSVTSFSHLQPISLWCLGRKGFSGSRFSRFKRDICPKWDGFQKILIKKKTYPCNISYFVHYIISPICFSVSWGCTGIDIVGQKLMIPPLC